MQCLLPVSFSPGNVASAFVKGCCGRFTQDVNLRIFQNSIGRPIANVHLLLLHDF